MKFGIFYEHQLPHSAGAAWDEDAERKLYQDALQQVELADRIERKRAEMAPFIEAALARKPRMAPIDPAAVPVVEALGRQGASPLQGTSDRGGGIPIATADLLKERPGLAAALAAHNAAEAEAAAKAKAAK